MGKENVYIYVCVWCSQVHGAHVSISVLMQTPKSGCVAKLSGLKSAIPRLIKQFPLTLLLMFA